MEVLILAIVVSLILGAIDWHKSTRVPAPVQPADPAPTPAVDDGGSTFEGRRWDRYQECECWPWGCDTCGVDHSECCGRVVDPESDDSSDDDDDTDPEPSLRAAWYDSRSCWGCERACKASGFHPYAGGNIGAEIRAAGFAHAQVSDVYHAGFAPREHGRQVGSDGATSVAAQWSDLCQRCGEWMRSGGSVRPAVVVAADEACPF